MSASAEGVSGETRGPPVASRLARKGAGAAKLACLLAARAPAILLRRHRFPRAAERLLAPFHGEAPASAEVGAQVSAEAFEDLVRYFAAGWRAYRTADGTGARYPGLPSWSDARVDDLEGFSRTMPLFAAWCASGRETVLHPPGGRPVSLPDEFGKGLVAGTDPASPAYWGDMDGPSNQRIVEAADIALALWLFRDLVWERLPQARREAVANWLSQVEPSPGLDNNWQLFYVLVGRVLAALGYPDRVPSARRRYERVREFHLGDGWFSDGPGGRVDFYNAWAFHYALDWIDRIDPHWDPEFIADCQRRFLAGYRYLIGPDGLPILGRSLCYRIAAPAPLVAGHDRHPDLVSAGEARRALDAVWRHFIRRGAVRDGTVTQGYWGADPRLLDPYSGPASGLWSLRSLVAAFRCPRDGDFWRSAGAPLPVERADYELTLEGPRWHVRGRRGTGCITVELPDNPPDAAPPLDPVSRLEVLRRHAERWPHTPRNTEAKYGRRLYRSDEPFCI